MQLTVNSLNNQATQHLDVSDVVFGAEFKEGLVHQVVTAYMAAGRAGTKAQKTRSEVSGGGIKPWKQKGTGRARAGTIRSPLWRKGGIIFAAKPRDYSQKVNRKMYRSAISSILSELVRQERLTVVDALEMKAPKTRELQAMLVKLGCQKGLILITGDDQTLHLSARNLVGVEVANAETIDPISLIAAERVIATVDAIKKLEERVA